MPNISISYTTSGRDMGDLYILYIYIYMYYNLYLSIIIYIYIATCTVYMQDYYSSHLAFCDVQHFLFHLQTFLHLLCSEL